MLYKYTNGNATIEIRNDGTRIIESNDDQLKLDFPLNIDIRVSSQCAFGLNPNTGKAICDFCHESATTTGKHADFDLLLTKLSPLPAGIELAVGVNQFNNTILDFFTQCKKHDWIVNCTVNQGHVRRDKKLIEKCLSDQIVKGLGVSYRKNMIAIPDDLIQYNNTVVHVIAGIDDIEDVKLLAKTNVKKILVLGEKNFGFNYGKVNIVSHSHKQWYYKIYQLFDLFDVVSFDNLALEQLNVKRFVKDWDTLYQHEYSMYINAADQYYSQSSRSFDKTDFGDISIQQYFKSMIEMKESC